MKKYKYDPDSPRRELEKLWKMYNELKDKYDALYYKYVTLKRSHESMKNNKDKKKLELEAKIAEQLAIIEELKNQLAHQIALSQRDGTNTGIPTSKTPINKKKVIPNSRIKSDKKKGGQPGHTKFFLKSFEEQEINDVEVHDLDSNEHKCDKCHGNLADTGKVINKDEYDVVVKVIKRRHQYKIYVCTGCGKEVHVPIENRLKENNQYSPNIQALALSLTASGNVAINKAATFISGITNNQIKLSDGYVCKLYKRASIRLAEFKDNLIRLMIQRKLLYWDDTVIFIQTRRACMRFYGDEQISLYFAHNNKDLEGILDDKILDVLTNETTVMHDHNLVNYNDLFFFENVECIQHLQRDLQKCADDNPDHTWEAKLKQLITDTIKARKDCIENDISQFEQDKLSEFNDKLDEILKDGYDNLETTNVYSTIKESTLLERIEEYRDNYFKWIFDFSVPTTNNLAERGLRCIKSHLKISGQFDNINSAMDYANVKTYIETCRKCGINEMVALNRLCSNNPYSVSELFCI